MTMFDTDLDSDLIMHLDFKLSPPCDGLGVDNPCDRPAAWFYVLGCCSHIVLICEEHHEETQEILKRIWSFHCGFCDTETVADKFYKSWARI